MKKDAPIGVFDSGVGGLTVAREIIRQIPSRILKAVRLHLQDFRNPMFCIMN